MPTAPTLCFFFFFPYHHNVFLLQLSRSFKILLSFCLFYFKCDLLSLLQFFLYFPPVFLQLLIYFFLVHYFYASTLNIAFPCVALLFLVALNCYLHFEMKAWMPLSRGWLHLVDIVLTSSAKQSISVVNFFNCESLWEDDVRVHKQKELNSYQS